LRILRVKKIYTTLLRNFSVALVVMVLFSLNACQHLNQTPKKSSEFHTVAWEAHQSKLKNIQKWHVKGKLGFSFPYQEKVKLVSANLDWEKVDTGFDMALSGPLGMGEFTIEKQPDYTRLINHKGDVYEASSPEQLFYQHTGMLIPWSDLEWWVLGVPAPEKEYDLKFLSEQPDLPESFQQSGWTVQFLSYEQWQGDTLPQKIKFTNGEIKATLIAREWELN